jgi:hypothetical protein
MLVGFFMLPAGLRVQLNTRHSLRPPFSGDEDDPPPGRIAAAGMQNCAHRLCGSKQSTPSLVCQDMVECSLGE